MHNIIQDNSIEKILSGMEIINDLIKPTFGGAGKNVIIRTKLYPYIQTTNDCETIVQAIKMKDKAQEIALLLVQELCSKQDKTAGNGRKTSVLIASEILKLGFTSDIDKNQLCKELQDLIPFIESEIDNVTQKITVNEIEGVATTASENKETGKLLQEIYQQIGANGILNIEGSKTYETSYKITNGVRFEMTGMLSPEMVHDEQAIKDKVKETKAVYERPLILVTKKKITTDDDINPLLRQLRIDQQRDLVIFTNDMDSNVASLLVNLHKSKDFNILIIKAPTMWQDFVFEDFAKCVGATIVEDKTGINFKNLKPEHLGTCDRIEVDSEDTILTGIQDLTEHMKELQAKGDDDSLLRLSWLATKSAVLKLGANSHQDLALKRLKANDANRSTYLALQYGIVKGGGKCLEEIGAIMRLKVKPTNAEVILGDALRVPFKQNIANGCEEIPDKVVDSAMVIKRAVRNAIGIASTILTSNAIIYIPDKTSQELTQESLLRSNNPFGQ